MKKEDRITIFLAPGELFWIAGNLGIKNLPLLGGYFRGRAPEDARLAIQQGFDTLVMRNLVHRQGKNTEIEPTLVGLVKLAAYPEFANVIGSIRKDEPPIQIYLFHREGQIISVVYKDRFFHFSMYREEAALNRSLFGWLGLSGQISERNEQITLPARDYSDILPKIWANPEKANEVMLALDLSDSEANRQADILKQIFLYTTMNRISLQTAGLVQRHQIILMGNPANLWAAETADPVQDNLVLKPMPAAKAALFVLRYLRSEVLQENEEDGEMI